MIQCMEFGFGLGALISGGATLWNGTTYAALFRNIMQHWCRIGRTTQQNPKHSFQAQEKRFDDNSFNTKGNLFY